MEKSYIEEKFKNLKRININEKAVGKTVIGYISEENANGMFYQTDDNKFYPSSNILEETNVDYYQDFFDFDLKDLETAEELEIYPFTIEHKRINKGEIKVSLAKQEEQPEEDIQVDKDEFIENFVENNIKLINASDRTYDILENIIGILAGKEESYGENEVPLEFTDQERIDILKQIYDGLDENKREEFLSRIEEQRLFNVSRDDIAKINEETKTETEEENIEEINTEEKTDDYDIPEENIDVTNPENTNEEEKEIKEELPQELNLDEDGPEITKYKQETEELERQLAELENKVAENVKIDEMADLIEQTYYEENQTIENNKEKELEEKLLKEEQNLKYYERQRENYINEYSLNDEANKKTVDKDGLPTLEVLKEMDAKIAEQKNNIENIKKEVYESEFKYKEYKQVNVEVWKFRELYEKEIESLRNTLRAVETKGNELYKENKGIPYEFHRITDDLNNRIIEMETLMNEKCGIKSIIDINSPENRILLEKVKDNRILNNNIKEEIKNKFDIEVQEEKNPDLENQINGLKDVINQRKENIEIYYSCKEDIKQLSTDLDNGLDPNAEDCVKRVENIDVKKMTLPEPLKNELTQYLKQVLDKNKIKKPKEPKPEEDNTKKRKKGLKVIAKKIWKWTKEHKFALIALGLALGLAAANALPLMMANSALWAGAPGFIQTILHGINVGLAKIVPGSFAFDAASGLYLNAAGAALYQGTASQLMSQGIGALGTVLTSLVAFPTIGAVIDRKIKKSWMKKKEKDEEQPEEKQTEEKQENENELTESEKLKAELEKAQKEKQDLETKNKELSDQIEELKERTLTKEEFELFKQFIKEKQLNNSQEELEEENQRTL